MPPDATAGGKAQKATGAPAGKGKKRRHDEQEEEEEESEDNDGDADAARAADDDQYLAGMVFAVSGALPNHTQPEVRQL